MPGILLSGPAGAGKSATARRLLLEHLGLGPAVVIDFQSLYAALLLLTRLPDGRYPEREERYDYLLPMVEYTRRAAITTALMRGLFPIATNSDGDSQRRQSLLDLLGPDATERVIDPGIEVVRQRLAVDGRVSAQCEAAISRWYDNL